MSPPTHFQLNTGACIPAVGLGTWQAKDGEVRKAVTFALKDGYTHIDTALIYGNEKEIGQGIKDSGISRKEIFITSKLWCTHHPNVKEGLQKSLDALDVDYLDLYLIHWPVKMTPNDTSELFPLNPDGTRAVDRSWDQSETWAQMEEVYRSGKVKAIGVSNWSIQYLEKLRKTWKVVPAVNQVELHPLLPQLELGEYCKSHGILLEAYSPLGSTGAPMMLDSDILRIAEKNNASAATILISYHVNKGFVVIPKSIDEKRMSSNRKIIPLSAEDLAVLDGLAAKGKAKRSNTPPWGHDLGFDDWYGPVKSG